MREELRVSKMRLWVATESQAKTVSRQGCSGPPAYSLSPPSAGKTRNSGLALGTNSQNAREMMLDTRPLYPRCVPEAPWSCRPWEGSSENVLFY